MNWNVRPGMKLRSFHLQFPFHFAICRHCKFIRKTFSSTSHILLLAPRSIRFNLVHPLQSINFGFCSMLNNMPNAFYSTYWGALREAMSMEKSIFSWNSTLSADDPSSSRQSDINNRVDLTMAQIHLIIESQQQINQLFFIWKHNKTEKINKSQTNKRKNCFFMKWNFPLLLLLSVIFFNFISFFPPSLSAIDNSHQPSTQQPQLFASRRCKDINTCQAIASVLDSKKWMTKITENWKFHHFLVVLTFSLLSLTSRSCPNFLSFSENSENF